MPLRPPGSTLFPYTTLFRSIDGGIQRRLRECLAEKRRDALGAPRVHQRVVDDRDTRLVRSYRAAHAFLAASRGRSVDRKSTRLNSSHTVISYAVFCLKKKKK